MKETLLNQKNEYIFLVIEKENVQRASFLTGLDPLYLKDHLNVTLNSLKMLNSIS